MEKMGKNTTFNAWDISLVLVIITELCLPHTLVSNVSLFLFATLAVKETSINVFLKINRVIFYYLLFFLYALIHYELGYADVPQLTKKILSTVFLCLFFSNLFCIYLRQTSIDKLRYIVFVSALLSCCLILVLTYLRIGTFVLRSEEEENGINSNTCAVFSAFAIVWTLCTSKIDKRIIIGTLVMLAFSALAGTRKSYIMVMMGWMIFTFLNKPSKIVRNITIVGIISTIAFWAVMNIPFLHENIGVRFETLFAMQQGEEGEASERTREYLIELGLYYINQDPWTGHGLDCFRDLHGLYAHNNYIELLYDIGIPGTILYYLMYIHLIKCAIINRTKGEIVLSSLAIGLLITTLFIHYAQVVYYSRVSLIMLFSMYAMTKKSNENI